MRLWIFYDLNERSFARRENERIRSGILPRKNVLAGIPLGRFASTGDIANVVALLASDILGYVTGGTIVVDGGYLTR